jgi:uncharacterized protein YPO0396
MTASQIAEIWNGQAKELEDMVKKATPWRAEMKKMRKRAEEINKSWYSIPMDDPDAQKANEANKRWERAREAAADLWWSI